MVRSAWPVLAPDPQLSLRRACGQRNAALRVGSGGEVGGEGVAQRQPPGGLDAALRTTHGFESCVGASGRRGSQEPSPSRSPARAASRLRL